MTGMSNFNFQRLLALTLSMAVSTTMASEVSLKGEGKLTGEITGMDADGVITLASLISGAPLQILGDQLEKIEFSSTRDKFVLPYQRMELTNGDILPVMVTSMDNGLLRVESPVLGALMVPREAVSSLQFGIIPQKITYSGPTDFSGWKSSKGDEQAWELEEDTLIAKGQGTLTRDADLPEKFIIRFTFTWQHHPNFQFGFAEDDKTTGERYLMEFGGSGFALYRESQNRVRTTIVMLARGPEQFTQKIMEVELRGDRSRGLLELRINGELEGRYTDPIQPFPVGTGISLRSGATRDSEQGVSDICILEWDDRGDRHRSEERGDGRSDSLIGRYGERFGGKLESIRAVGASKVYIFKSDFQKDPLELPEEEVSTVFLGSAAVPSKSDNVGGLILNLRGHGTMRISSCTIEGDRVKIMHPLLGSVEFARSGVASIERIWISKEKPTKKR